MPKKPVPRPETRVAEKGGTWVLEIERAGTWQEQAQGSREDMERLARWYRQPKKVIFRASEGLIAQMKARAAEEGISLQALFERAIERELKEAGRARARRGSG